MVENVQKTEDLNLHELESRIAFCLKQYPGFIHLVDIARGNAMRLLQLDGGKISSSLDSSSDACGGDELQKIREIHDALMKAVESVGGLWYGM